MYYEPIGNVSLIGKSNKRYGVSNYEGDTVPLVQSYANDVLSEKNLDSHVQKHMNRFKTVDLAISGAGGTMGWYSYDTNFGNWRSTAGINVDPRILPRLDTTAIGFSCTQEFEPFWDKVVGNQLVSLIDKAASTARMFAGETTSAIYVPAYQKMPVLKGIGTLECMSSVKFNFEFGQAGLYNALEEVVKPVIAIAKSFMPRGGGTRTWGNAPSIEYALNKTVQSFLKKLLEKAGLDGQVDNINELQDLLNAKPEDKNKTEKRTAAVNKAAKDASSGVEAAVSEEDKKTAREAIDSKNAENAGASDADKDNERKANYDLNKNWIKAKAKSFADALTDIQDEIYKTLNETAASMLGDYTGVIVRIGRFQTPSMIVKDVKFEFDFEEVDENGFPSKGSVELGGLESVKSAYSGLINAPSSKAAENGNDAVKRNEDLKLQ